MPQNNQTLLEKTVADQWQTLPSGLTVIVRPMPGYSSTHVIYATRFGSIDRNFRLDGKEVLVESNGTKTKSSKRTLPLVPVFRERLLALQEEQKENRKLCGRCYNKKYADYICVDAMGNLLKPDYLSNSFQIILQNYHLRRIRFHDLRHSCASLLLANGVPMKMIQEWLGHSDFSTTANIYSHLDYASKVSSAEAMLNGLGMGSNLENDT